MPGRVGFKFPDLPGKIIAFNGQIPAKFKLLTIQPACHQGKYHAVGAGKWFYGCLHFLRNGHEYLPGIGNAWAACFTDDANGFAGMNGLRNAPATSCSAL